jgi:hypothetical protein
MRSARGKGAERVTLLRFAVLIFWAGTAVYGLFLRIVWLSPRAGRPTRARVTSFPAAVAFAHPTVAVIGLALWLVFLHSQSAIFAWTAFGVLSAAAMLGFALLTSWLVGRGGKHAGSAGQRIPAKLVLVHGAAGLVTFALALIAANLAGQLH